MALLLAAVRCRWLHQSGSARVLAYYLFIESARVGVRGARAAAAWGNATTTTTSPVPASRWCHHGVLGLGGPRKERRTGAKL